MLMALALILAGIPLAPAKEAAAAKKMKLSKTKLSLKVGKTKKLTVKNKKKKAKVTWSTSKKKVATVSKKGVVKAKKAGKATITAKVKYKKKTTKLKCKVTVTKKTQPKTTAKPTTRPTAKPTAQPTAKPTAKPTAGPTAKPTATPGSGVTEPAKAKKWDAETMGGFYIAGIRFEDDSLTYSMDYGNTIYLDLGSRYMDVKAAVPDLTKCSFEVYAGRKSYTEVQTGDIQWKNANGGYYVFTLYIDVDGITYSSTWEMREGSADSTDTAELVISSIKAGDRTIALQKDLRSDGSHYMFDPAGANVKADLPDLKTVEFTATYMGKNLTVEKVSNIRWSDRSYYETWDGGTGYYDFTLYARNGAQRMTFDLYLSDCKDLLEINQYSYQIDGKEKKEPIAAYNQILSVEVPEGKSLKEVFPDLAASFTFECIYRDTICRNVKPADVKWVAESFHENQCDQGYYTFRLSATVGDKTVTGEFMLTEKYRGITYEVSGKLFDADGESPAGQQIRFRSSDTGEDGTATTAADGTYRVQLQEGTYDEIYWNQWRLSDCTVTVGKKAMTYDIRTDLHKVSGIITRFGRPMADCDIRINTETWDQFVYCHTDSSGAYSVYLPKRKDEVELVLYNSMEELLDDNWEAGKVLVQYEGMTLGKICQEKNIDIRRVKVSGTIYRQGTAPLAGVRCIFSYETEDGGSYDDHFLTQDDGSYEVYLRPDRNYQLLTDDYILIDEDVQVSKADVEKNFNVGATRIRGTVRAKNGDAVPDHPIWFCPAEGASYVARADAKGNYSVTLKPGTYTVQDGLWGAEMEQTVTVGAEDRVMDLTMPLYKISATAYNNDKAWEETLYIEDVEERTDVTGPVDGVYTFYVPAGEYKCNLVHDDTPLSAQAETITVTDRDLTPELRFTYQRVKGNLYRLRSGNWFDRSTDENYGGFNLRIEDEEGNDLGWIFTWGGENKGYEAYLPGAGTYKVIFHGSEVCSFTTDNSPEVTQDLICQIYKVSGELTGIRGLDDYVSSENLYFSTEEEAGAWDSGSAVALLGRLDKTEGKQPYTVWVPAGTYYYHANFDRGNVKTGSITVSADREHEDIEMPPIYKISGTVRRISGPWEGVTIYCRNDAKTYYAETGEDGSYELYVVSGEYTLEVSGVPMDDSETVTVSDRDVTKDISVNLVRISGTVTRNGKGLDNVSIQLYKGEEYQGDIWTDSEGRYEIYADPDTSYILSAMGTKESVAVTTEDVSCDMAVTAAKVSGTITESDGTSSTDAFEIYQKDEEGNVLGQQWINTDWGTGNYECYLPAGTYYVSYNIDLGDGIFTLCEHGSFTVGAGDMTYNIQKKASADLKHTVSGTLLSRPGGKPLAGRGIRFYYNKDMIPTVTTTDQEGKYEVELYEGSYSINVTGLDGWQDLFTVGAEDKTYDIELNLVSISGTVTQDGSPVAGLTVTMSNEKTSETCTTGEDGSYTFYVGAHSGTYQISCDNAESLDVDVEGEDLAGKDLILASKKE